MRYIALQSKCNQNCVESKESPNSVFLTLGIFGLFYDFKTSSLIYLSCWDNICLNKSATFASNWNCNALLRLHALQFAWPPTSHVSEMFFLPPGVVGVHAVSSIWGLMSVGLFARSDKMRYALGICHKRYGLFYVSSNSLKVQTYCLLHILFYNTIL